MPSRKTPSPAESPNERLRSNRQASPPSNPAPLRVILVSPRNPLNIGAAARAMSNFGVADLRLVQPYDVAFREAKSAVKSHYVLEAAQVFDHLSDAIADCGLIVGTTAIGPRALEHPMKRLELGGRLISKRLAGAEPVALLFGSEKFGLSNGDLSYCHWLTRIPTREEHGSMNLGQAVAVCLYEIFRTPEAARVTPDAKRKAPAERVDRMAAMLEEVLRDSGYMNAVTDASTKMKIRRLTRRMDLTSHDAEVWLGMLRQIQWRLKTPR